jgi:tetratricopeptide (TPR) repeat protein
VYWVAFEGLPGQGGDAERIEPLHSQARAVEQAIAERRFAEALPIAAELESAYPRDAIAPFWLAAIYRGLERPADEAAAWERFVSLSATRDVACPALPHAYSRAGNEHDALRALVRCAEFDPQEPERTIDLALGLERAGRIDEALAAWRRASEQDPHNRAVPEHIARLTHPGEER